MNTILSMTLLIGLSFVLMSQTGGCGTNPTPTAVQGSFQTGLSSYNCAYGSPAALTKTNQGLLIVDITSNNPPQFKYNYTNSYTSGNIDCGFYANCCVTAQFPQSSPYTVTLYYNELGTVNCPPPGLNTCYRWFIQANFDSGFLPDCGDGTSVIFINQMNPSGFVGPCT